MWSRERTSDAEEDEGAEAVLDKADDILQKPVKNKDNVKKCIAASTTRIAFITKNSVEDVLTKYPYLKEADLVRINYNKDDED